MSRNNIILTGLAGLVGAVLVTALCLLVVVQGWVSIWITEPIYAWAILLFLAIFSLAEIPVMLYGIQQIAKGSEAKAKNIALFVNGIYVLFAAVYAVPYILLTGGFGGGLALTALSVVRFLSSIIFLPHEQKL